jgi:hypothetical protein
MSTRLALCLAFASFLAACGNAADGAEASSRPSASASALPSAAELSDYCGRVCKKTTACGLEAADGIVRGNPTEVSLLSRLKADAAKTEAACRDECASGAAESTSRAALDKANTCVQQSSCDALEACLVAASSK